MKRIRRYVFLGLGAVLASGCAGIDQEDLGPGDTTAGGMIEDDDDPGDQPAPLDAGETECDPVASDCPSWAKCTAVREASGRGPVDANRCRPIQGHATLGDPCIRSLDNDDCIPGLFCMTASSGSEGEGTCLAFCDPDDPDSCTGIGGAGTECVLVQDALPLCTRDTSN